MEVNTANASAAPAAAPATTEDVYVDHYCEHPGCKAWGSFGRLGQMGETAWKCFAHDLVYGAAK